MFVYVRKPSDCEALMRRWQTETLPEAIENSVKDFVDAYKTGKPRKMMKAFLERKKG